MAYRKPLNPAKMSQSKFRQFDGIGGPEKQLLKRFNQSGHNISNTVANDTSDLNLLENGSMILRDGSRKINGTGESDTVTNLMEVTVGNVLAYGVVVAGALKVITLPTENVRLNPFEMEPANQAPALATVYPSTDPSIRYP